MNRFVRMIAAVGVVALAAVPHAARATTLAPLTHDQMVDAADLVVEGTVQKMWTFQDDKGRTWTRAEVLVERELKDAAAATSVGGTITVEAAGGESPDGTVTTVALTPRYSVGERALLYLCERRFGTMYGTVGMMMGKFTIRQNPADGSDMVVRFAVPYPKTYDARFIPNPPVSERVSLVSMEAAIERRVAEGWDGQPIPGAAPEHLRLINKLQPGVK